MKVLMVAPHFPPVITGASLHVYHLVKGLEAYGINARVHTIRAMFRENPVNFLEVSDLNVKSFEPLFNLTRTTRKFAGNEEDQPVSPGYVTSTVKACNEFDIVHVHDGPKVCNDLLMWTLRKIKPKKPLVFTPHGYLVTLPAYARIGVPSSGYKLSSKIYWWLGIPLKIIRNSSKIIAVNPFQAELFAKIFGNEKVFLIPEAVPPQYFVDSPTFVDDGTLKILFIGRIIKEKGIQNLLYAMHKVRATCDKGRRMELICIGPDCGYLQEISRIINNLRLNTVVKILGPLPERQKIEYLSWCDALVSPSYHEAFGLTILEAMARGKPVIATETIGSKWLVKHQENGFLVKVGDTNGIALSLERLLRDSELIYQMGKRAIEHASKFNMKSMIEKHINVYKVLCD